MATILILVLLCNMFMYQHHKDSICNMIGHFQSNKEVIALFLTGSVANGNEREDSDLDGVVIVTDEYYNQKRQNHQLEESILGKCTYEGGYFDVKYMSKDALKDISNHGSEIYRSLFQNARTLFTQDPELPDIVNTIRKYPIEKKEEKFLRFYSSVKLAYDYYWCVCKVTGYMRRHMADQIVYHVYRLILLENEIMIPSCRRLEQSVIDAKNKPEGIVTLCTRLMDRLQDEDAKEVITTYEKWTKMPIPKDYSVIVNNYIDPYECF